MLKTFFKLKYQEKDIECPYCKHHVDVKYYGTKYHRVYLTCGHYINPFKDTPFFKTRIPLDKLWDFFNCFNANSMSCSQAARMLGISTMGAWHILKRMYEWLQQDKNLINVRWINKTFFEHQKMLEISNATK